MDLLEGSVNFEVYIDPDENGNPIGIEIVGDQADGDLVPGRVSRSRRKIIFCLRKRCFGSFKVRESGGLCAEKIFGLHRNCDNKCVVPFLSVSERRRRFPPSQIVVALSALESVSARNPGRCPDPYTHLFNPCLLQPGYWT